MGNGGDALGCGLGGVDDLVEAEDDLGEVFAAGAELVDAFLHGGHRVLAALADLLRESADLLGAAAGRLGQLADFVGDHGEAAAVLAGACGFDGGVEREEVRLLGDPGDGDDDLADLLSLLAEGEDGLGRGFDLGENLLDLLRGELGRGAARLRRGGRAGGHFRSRLRGVGAGLDRGGDAGDQAGGTLDQAQLLFGALGDGVHRLLDLFGGAGHVPGTDLHFVGAVGDGPAGVLDVTHQVAQVLLHVRNGDREFVDLVGAEHAGALGGERLRQVAAADLQRAAVQADDAVRHLLEADRDRDGHQQARGGASQRVLRIEAAADDFVGQDSGEHCPDGHVAEQDLEEEADAPHTGAAGRGAPHRPHRRLAGGARRHRTGRRRYRSPRRLLLVEAEQILMCGRGHPLSLYPGQRSAQMRNFATVAPRKTCGYRSTPHGRPRSPSPGASAAR